MAGRWAATLAAVRPEEFRPEGVEQQQQQQLQLQEADGAAGAWGREENRVSFLKKRSPLARDIRDAPFRALPRR